MYDVIVYKAESGQCPIEKYLKKLTQRNQSKDLAQIHLYVNRLKEHGMAVNNFYPGTIRRLQGDVYELRPDNHRVLFFYFTGKEFVLLHAFQKQHQKAPSKEIQRAEKEMADYIRRNGNE